jgi:23S rRNA pseudouridine955/2504/2580 synthase
MMVAKNPVAAGKWTKLIGSKAVKKEYIAVCAGKMPSKNGIIKEDIVQHGDSKAAVTHYQVEKEWTVKVPVEEGEKEIPMTQVRLKLETGRMHQIRIHLAKNECPIAGDDQHGNFKINKMLKKACGIKRLQLASVCLTVPLNSKEQSFIIDNPLYNMV